MGFGELLFILFIVLLFFGAGRLPAVGEGLGKAMRGLKEALRSAPPAAPPGQPPDAAPPGKELPPGGSARG